MLTLVQLYNLGIVEQIDIFSGLSLPADSPFDRTLIINSIIEHCGLNYPVYADPNVMKSAITIWSAKNQYTFEHLAKILTAQYSPIENKDYTEETTYGRDLTDNTTGNTKRDETVNAKNKTVNSGADITEDTTSAYNSSSYEPDNKSTFTHGATIDNEGDSKKNIGMDNTTDKTVKEETITKSHQHGNVGITSNVALQLEEYGLMKDYNPYTFIAGLFENELTLFDY